MLKTGCALVLAALVCPALVKAQVQTPTTGNVVISNGATCFITGPSLDVIGDLTGAATTSAPCNTTTGEYFFQSYPSGVIPQVVTYIPQVVDGGVWKTTIVITNTTASPATASLACYQESSAGKGATQPWTPPFLENVFTQSMSLTPGGTIFLDTPGTNPNLSQGWCAVTASDGVKSHAVFSLSSNNSQGTAAAVITSNDIVVPVDNSNGSLTAVAVANPSSTDTQTVTIYFRNTTQSALGASSLPTILTLPPNGHTSLLISTQNTESAGQRGLAEFIVSGTVSLLALQFNSTLNFTSAQAYPVTNGPVIRTTDPITCVQNPLQSGCPSPAFFLLTLNASFATNLSAFPMVVNITPGPVGYSASLSGLVNGQTVSGSFVGGTLGGSGNQVTLSFQNVGQGSTFVGGSMYLTLTQTDFDSKIGEAVGTIAGQFTLAQNLVSNGTISGIFNEITPVAAIHWVVDTQ